VQRDDRGEQRDDGAKREDVVDEWDEDVSS
jgi:hypothetical protein